MFTNSNQIVTMLARTIITKTWARSSSNWLGVEPVNSQVDQEVTVRAGGLAQKTRVVLETNLRDEEQRINFQSVCHYLTTEQGELDTEHQAPLPGSSYEGVHRSGPLWSVGRLPGSVRRVVFEDVTKPMVYEMELKCPQSGQVLDSQEITKRFVAPGVERRTIRSGRVRGTLFLPPPSDQPAPAIITILGGLTSKGRVPEDR